MKRETIDGIGVWALRLVLVGGLIAAEFTGKDGLGAACAIGLLWSFLFL